MATTKKRETHRTERVSARVLQELSAVLLLDFNDPRLAGVVLSHVAVTDDLSLVRVAVVVMNDEDDQRRAKAALKVLSKLVPAIRAKLAPRLAMRRTPALSFTLDQERKQVDALDALLDEVATELKRVEPKGE